MKLVEYLKQFEGMDSEAEVCFSMQNGCCGDTFDLEAPEIDQFKTIGRRAGEPEHYVTIRFPALDFLSSCIRSGAAQRAGAKKP